ncbi:hypothetical protein V4R08_01995 [Nitrobacter sp. NHB1]|uniref:hypothetical protein n=1 Tax=Nitrobacter sp. NHB1 TaxID=3119830 RepID=UPI002FFF8F66
MSQNQDKKPSGLLADTTKLTIGIGSNLANVVYPGAGILGSVLTFAIDRFIKRPQNLLVEELQTQEVSELPENKASLFVPMAYRYFEAAKEGEYEHNLRLLASFIANELKQEVPDAPAVSRMARRLEGLTKIDLKVIALINSSLTSPTKQSLNSRPFVSAHGLANDANNKDKIDRERLSEALAEIASRGLLIPDGASRMDKGEEYYFASLAFGELMERAEAAIEKINAEQDENS